MGKLCLHNNPLSSRQYVHCDLLLIRLTAYIVLERGRKRKVGPSASCVCLPPSGNITAMKSGSDFFRKQ